MMSENQLVEHLVSLFRGLRYYDKSNTIQVEDQKGLRALADAMDAGRVDDALTRMKKDVEERQAAIAARKS